jgi:hypothetical protein
MSALNENIGQIYKIHTRYQQAHLSFYHHLASGSFYSNNRTNHEKT